MKKKSKVNKSQYFLKKTQLIDLSHVIDEKSPHHQMMDKMKINTKNLRKKHGYIVQSFHLPCSWGTHIDAPNEFHKNLKTLDKIELKMLVLPLIVIDIHNQTKKNPL